jgi:hypothetical protein
LWIVDCGSRMVDGGWWMVDGDMPLLVNVLLLKQLILNVLQPFK